MLSISITYRKNTLEGESTVWFNVVEERCGGCSEFKRALEEQYWGEIQQVKLG